MLKTGSLKKNRDFLRVYRRAGFSVAKNLVMYVQPNNFKVNRLGITIGRKVGNSVKRNRIRRLVKENYRSYEEFLSGWHDIVFVVRKTGVVPKHIDIKKEMKYLLKKMKLFSQEKNN